MQNGYRCSVFIKLFNNLTWMETDHQIYYSQFDKKMSIGNIFETAKCILGCSLHICINGVNKCAVN